MLDFNEMRWVYFSLKIFSNINNISVYQSYKESVHNTLYTEGNQIASSMHILYNGFQ